MPTRVDPVTEVFEPGERIPARDPWIERLAWLMDQAIPLGRWRIGLDGLVGLVPGFGDLAGTMIAMIIVLRAVNAGIPRVAVARMMTNIAIDSLIGAIPVAGDLFDFAYKSNMKNLRIYQEAMKNPRESSTRNWGFMAVLLIGGGVLIAALIIGFAAMLRTILG